MSSRISELVDIKTDEMTQSEKVSHKLLLINEIKRMSNPNSDWHLLHEMLQEIVATKRITQPEHKLTKKEMMELLKINIEKTYEDDENIKKLLLSALPEHPRYLEAWTNKKGWEEAVWAKIRNSNLFSQSRRAMMINSLYERGMEKDTQAAKIWLQLSGDLVEKSEVVDSTQQKYKEINKILHKKIDVDN